MNRIYDDESLFSDDKVLPLRLEWEIPFSFGLSSIHVQIKTYKMYAYLMNRFYHHL